MRDDLILLGDRPPAPVRGLCAISIGGQGSSSHQSTQPWYAQQPYLRDIYGQAQQLSQQPREYYPGSTVVPFSPETEGALQMQTQLAAGGDPTVDAARGYTGDVLGGNYLGANPWLDRYFGAASRGVTRAYQTVTEPSITSRFGGARYGSPGHVGAVSRAQDTLGMNLTDLAAKIYGPDYQAERGYQEAAATRAPGYAQYDYQRAAAMGDVGMRREDLATRELQNLMDRFYFNQEEPTNRLAQYSSMIGAPVSTSSGNSHSWGFNVGLMNNCHVAAEFFGWYTPDWWAARRWILHGWRGAVAERFRALYAEHAPRLAELVRRDPEIRERLRPYFERARDRGRACGG